MPCSCDRRGMWDRRENVIVSLVVKWLGRYGVSVPALPKDHEGNMIQYVKVYYKMDDLNITMEEYIRLEEEKARKRRKVFNWKTASYGKIWYYEDVHDLRSVETEFLAIIFNDNLTSNETLSCEPTVKNDNEKVSVLLFPSPEPTVSCIDDLDFFKDFENEFPAIVYNDALTSKSDFSTKPTLCP
ncbi:hypothetical protein Tco_1403488 [Tanacetum coccineum]